LEHIRELIDAIKVPNALALQEGASVYSRFSDKFGLPVFADLKIADVPHTNAEIVRVACDRGASAVMIHAFVGPDGILAALDAANGRAAVIAQLELTSPGGVVFNSPITEGMAELAANLGVDGVQAPGNRPIRIRQIRKIVGSEVGIVCCGVGIQGGQFRDVVKSGADYAIIGRAIYQADDPGLALKSLLAD
jgi:orotidine-5'-phosphate decarboxylase